ncbi:MAG TPA: polyprenyl synthetase family protein, partial [Candidatus Jeotgalibaca merdavium]|nr:polyprenyl synthetase family protein [Candidatus Jeotgalibaca merdavium]
ITDDILDYSETGDVIGKPAMQDVRNGIYTAPLLYAMQTHKKEIEPYLLKGATISDSEVQDVLELVKAAGGIEKARVLAEKYTNKALKQINQLPESQAKTTISRISEQMLARKF